MPNSFTMSEASAVSGESTLSITRTDLLRHVSRYYGFNLTFASCSADEQTLVIDVVQSGERQFYQPPVLPGERTAHVWSFLTPILELPLVADQWEYDLPADFGGLVNPRLSYSEDDNARHELKITSVAKILRLRQGDDASNAEPQYAATNWKASNQTDGQRYQLLVWPTPSSEYTVKGLYYSNPNAISNSAPYPLGGQPHAETLIQSCLAIAEQRDNDSLGHHTQLFMQRLSASVSLDRKVSTPQFFGYNGDGSNERRAWCDQIDRTRGSYATYEGVYE